LNFQSYKTQKLQKNQPKKSTKNPKIQPAQNFQNCSRKFQSPTTFKAGGKFETQTSLAFARQISPDAIFAFSTLTVGRSLFPQKNSPLQKAIHAFLVSKTEKKSINNRKREVRLKKGH
jgi:hypothetical protein